MIGVGVEVARLADPRLNGGARLCGPIRDRSTRIPIARMGAGPRDLILAVFVDLNRWRDVVYVLVAFPLAILEFVARGRPCGPPASALLSLPLLALGGDLPVQLADGIRLPGPELARFAPSRQSAVLIPAGTLPLGRCCSSSRPS